MPEKNYRDELEDLYNLPCAEDPTEVAMRIEKRGSMPRRATAYKGASIAIMNTLTNVAPKDLAPKPPTPFRRDTLQIVY